MVKDKILVVEDDIDNAELLAHLLNRSKIFVPILANNGKEAKIILDEPEQRIDIKAIITDLRMPEETGFELLDRLKDIYNQDPLSIPVFIFTSYDDPATWLQLIDPKLGFVCGVFTKPLRNAGEDLLRDLERAINKKEDQPINDRANLSNRAKKAGLV
jgi:DNA-binding NtrC family response regulator